MRQKLIYVKDMMSYLEKRIQKIVKSPVLIRNGRELDKMINILPREELGLFLICSVGRFISNQDWRPASDHEERDGIIVRLSDDRSKLIFATEQVYVPRIKEKSPADIDEIVERIGVEIKKKHSKGKMYYENRHLVIFLDIEGLLDYQKVKKIVDGLENGFDSYWLFAPWERQCSYLVFLLKSSGDQPTAYSVEIMEDFRGVEVKRLGRL